MENTPKKLFLLDAYALIYRAFFALSKRPTLNSKGLNTSAIMGFLNTLYDVLQNERPTHIGIAFDVSSPTNRQQEFLDYKANRESMPEDLRASIPYIINLIQLFNIPIYAVEGFEADDVIGTLSHKAEQQGFVTYMMTPDKDFGQLVTDKVLIYKPAKFGTPAQVWGPKEVCERYGISHPTQLIDILGLWGDAADNIPGIPGIGEKNASALISRYGSVENVINNADDLKGKQRENVINFAEQGLLSKKLATICLDVPVEFNEEELLRKQPDVPGLMKFFEEMEFRTFARRFANDYPTTTPPTTPIAPTDASGQFDLFAQDNTPTNTLSLLFPENNTIPSHTYTTLDDDTDISVFVNNHLTSPHFALAVETSQPQSFDAPIVNITFSYQEHEAFNIPVPQNETGRSRLETLRPLLENPSALIIGYDLKQTFSALQTANISLKGSLFDTMIAHYIIEPEQRHSLDYLAEIYLHRKMDAHKAAFEEADFSLQLYSILKPIISENGMDRLFNEIEMPLIPVLSTMESNGVRIDSPNLQQISNVFAQEIYNIEESIFELSGTRFNISSPRQLGEVLFSKLKIDEKAKKTKTGQYATGEEVLQKLIDRHPVVAKILDYRSFTKLKSTYLDALPALINPNDGLIHTSYNQAVTATGRLSSNNPNLQNIPVRTEKGREIRRAFVPRDEQHTLMAADYSQIELRIIAHLSGDPAMVNDFNLGHDIHAATAAKVFHVDIADVTKQQRSRAKAVNFGIIYGMSAFGLAQRMELSRSEAADIIKHYFEEYAGIKEYMNRSIALAKERGYAETILGRRRYLRDINAANSVVRNFAERNAINAPIQGSSADMIKIAMVNIHQEMQRLHLQSKMILQVHDELVFDARLDELDTLKSLVNEKMVNAMPLSVPVIVEINTGNNWLEAH